MTIPNYTLRSDFELEEEKRLKRETECPHAHWATKCGVCGKYLASDHHIVYHTAKTFKKDSRVGIYMFEGLNLTTSHIRRFRDIKQRYDKLVVLVDTLEQYQLLSELGIVWKVSYESLFEEVKRQRKYNSEAELSLVLYPDTKYKETVQHLGEMSAYYNDNLQVDICAE